MLRIGLTGGIGSGKSTVAGRFRDHGIPVIDADEVAREVVEPGEPAHRELVAAFGGDVLDADGRVDRARLRERVFADPAQRRRLEAILHPRIRESMRRRADALDAPYCILMIPLLVESGGDYRLDRVLVVDADAGRRTGWVQARSSLNREEVRRIMDTQAGREERLAAADDVIENDGDLDDLARKVDALHERYLALARGGG
jgi:dephospho-CoA kinase